MENTDKLWPETAMKTPKKLTVDEFFAVIQSFLDDRCATGEGPMGLVCKSCKSKIMTELIPVALHEASLAVCVETGIEQLMRIPYCSKCEYQPEPEACIHVPSPSAFFEWCELHKVPSQLVVIRDRRRGRREKGIPRRRMVREYFERDAAPEILRAFARADVHKVLTDSGYWLNEFDGDFTTYVRRGGKDFIETHRRDGSWRHVTPGEKEVEGAGIEELREHLA